MHEMDGPYFFYQIIYHIIYVDYTGHIPSRACKSIDEEVRHAFYQVHLIIMTRSA